MKNFSASIFSSLLVAGVLLGSSSSFAQDAGSSEEASQSTSTQKKVSRSASTQSGVYVTEGTVAFGVITDE